MVPSRSLRRLLSTKPSTNPYSLETFKEFYPISIDGPIRDDSFAKQHETLQWYDKKIILPVRQTLANYTTDAWINARFKSDEIEEPYLPGTFLEGAKGAIKKFFALLQDDIKLTAQGNKESDSVETSRLQKIVSLKLFDELHFHHQEIANRGLELDIRLNSISHVEKKDTWITFGNRNYVSTTLNKAQIHTTIAPLVYWRYVPGSRIFIFSELNFEYVLPATQVPGADHLDEDLEGPTLGPRLAATREGAVLGIDVSFDADITITIKPAGSEQVLWVDTLRRPLLIRLETSHFIGRYDGKWKIADLDNFYASDLF